MSNTAIDNPALPSTTFTSPIEADGTCTMSSSTIVTNVKSWLTAAPETFVNPTGNISFASGRRSPLTMTLIEAFSPLGGIVTRPDLATKSGGAPPDVAEPSSKGGESIVVTDGCGTHSRTRNTTPLGPPPPSPPPPSPL